MATTAQQTERPWHRRSGLYARESEIRALRADGYSLRQVIDRLDLRVSRSTLHRWLRRARPADEPAASATPAAPGAVESAEAAAEDAAALAVLDSSGFSPPTTRALK